jgi:nucleotide-binding universal stress UspA family protein
MNSKRILVPLDLRRSTTDAQLYLQQAASESPFCATLLYVVELNIVTPNRLYQEICAESEAALRNLSMALLGHENAARVSVRIGRPDEEILAEARASRSELILLTSSRPRRWSQPFRSRTVERVVQLAPCPTLVLPLSSPIASGFAGADLPRRPERLLLGSESCHTLPSVPPTILPVRCVNWP